MEFEKAYKQHRKNAARRKIDFLLTLEEWTAIWVESGHWAERGCRRGQYVMARIGDQGPYAVGNVKIISTSENIREMFLNVPNLRNKVTAHWTFEERSKTSKDVQNRPEVSAAKSKKQSRACTVDGVTIFSSARALIKALGQGVAGYANPNFRYINCPQE